MHERRSLFTSQVETLRVITFRLARRYSLCRNYPVACCWDWSRNGADTSCRLMLCAANTAKHIGC
jgi:hypothetical protein